MKQSLVPLSDYCKFHIALRGLTIYHNGKEIDRAEAFARWPKAVKELKAGDILGVRVEYKADWKQGRMK